jgi:cysteine desulfurase/selenocysteine lyase
MLPLIEYRKEFPILQKYRYLDHAGIAPVSQRVVDAVRRFLDQAAGGAAFHYPEWSQQVTEIRSSAAQLINAESDEVAFVRSTSHGLSLVSEGMDWRQGDRIIVYEKEFPSNLFPWMHLKRKGVDVHFLPDRDGRILFEDVEHAVNGRTRLLSVSTVQFSRGFRIDLEHLGRFCRDKGILLCVDAIQSLGLLPMDVKACSIDFLSADAHKWLMGPEGIGIFYCRKDLAEALSPPLTGWKSVRNELAFESPVYELKESALRFEEGSLNILGIIGLGAAIGLLREVGLKRIEQQVLDLGERIIQEADARGMGILTPRHRNERGGIVTVAGLFDPVVVREGLRREGIMVNCRAGGIRMSPHFYNTSQDIEDCFHYLDILLAQ